MDTPKLLEADIKARLINYLHEKNRISQSSVIISELTVGSFARRVDLVLASPTELVAYEIKSASDNLTRLQGQIDDYLKYFDKVVVVADSKHIESILQTAPKNVGVWELSEKRFTVKRRGVKAKVTDKSYIASFLTTPEITKLTPTIHRTHDRLKRKELVLKANSIKALRNEVYAYLQRKFSLTSQKTLEKLENGFMLNTSDIEKLSVYIPERRAIKRKKALKSKLWQTWEDELDLSA
ncbi:sce7726 family protein [Vibrio paucivorans]|uniref:Sce7726 family protein n=1 Tax=Vibrio paucivorans TaxID=2829489 RepID=A0A9X3HUJ2_9VIBR|nr:sce7726 family protein [Vibrio paucivorans]MCW8336643.1 sce7726 family protein [Vibrio paucivorans]